MRAQLEYALAIASAATSSAAARSPSIRRARRTARGNRSWNAAVKLPIRRCSSLVGISVIIGYTNERRDPLTRSNDNPDG
jgi:hypothetical protein